MPDRSCDPSNALVINHKTHQTRWRWSTTAKFDVSHDWRDLYLRCRHFVTSPPVGFITCFLLISECTVVNVFINDISVVQTFYLCVNCLLYIYINYNRILEAITRLDLSWGHSSARVLGNRKTRVLTRVRITTFEARISPLRVSSALESTLVPISKLWWVGGWLKVKEGRGWVL
jgi:hypothetical protein